jgi:membrane protease YdiL (CAAX protease family)
LFRKIKNSGNETALLLASALLFGVSHFYSLFYMIYAFLMGLTLMYGYMVRVKSDQNAFWLIVIAHSMFNLGIFIKNVI